MLQDDDISKFINSYIKAPSEFLRELEVYAKENFVPIIKPETAAFLKSICALKHPKRILEAGTAIGYSSIIMAEFLDEYGRLDTIEIDSDKVILARENIKRAGLTQKINVILGDATEVLRCLNKKYDMVFLDSAKGQYKEILADAKRVLNPGGILIADNVLFDGRTAKDFVGRKFRTIVVNMREFIDRLTEDDDFVTSILTIGDGLTFSIKK